MSLSTRLKDLLLSALGMPEARNELVTTLENIPQFSSGNLSVSGTITATGTITGGNLATAGAATATGAVTGGSLVTTAGNITSAATISVNSSAGNVRINNGITTGALIVPVLTTTQRNALTGVAGMVIFNSTAVKHQGYDGTTWNDLY